MSGMNIARFNFSHGSHEYQLKLLSNLREALVQCPGKKVEILLDTKGPEVRTKLIYPEQPVEVFAGETLNIMKPYTNLEDYDLDHKKYKSISTSLESITTCVVEG